MPPKKEPKPIPPVTFAQIIDLQDDPYHPTVAPFAFPPYIGEGLFEMPDTQYFSLPIPDYSFYKAFAQSPQHGLAYLRGQGKRRSPQQQKNLDFGTACHWILLEPELFEKRVVIDCGLNKVSNDYKAWRETVPDGSIVLTSKEVDACMKMRDRAMRKPTIRELLNGKGLSEVAGIAKHVGADNRPTYPLFHKIRIDRLTESGVIIDYKTAASASRWGFMRSIEQFKYYWQVALYLPTISTITGYAHTRWYWLVQEKSDPWECRLVEADRAEIQQAEVQLEGLMEHLTECIESNYWPGYVDAGIDLPVDVDDLETNFDYMDEEEVF